MATTFWGVDSVAAAHQPVPAVTGKTPLYDYLVGKGLTPSFFGRYLGKATTVLSKAEADFLLGKGCKILPVYRSGSVNGQSGSAAAAKAISAAKAVGVAPGTVIYTDVEPLEKPSVDYIKDWCKTMWSSPFGGAGGFYCNNWSGSDFMKAFKKAYDDMDASMRAAVYLWCQYPLKACGQSSSFAPSPPTFFPTGPNVWQYALGCLKYSQGSNKYALIDMNTANMDGYNAMWG